MYMNYVIKNRLRRIECEGRRPDPYNAFILTTDADIDFKAESVEALLDFLARDDTVGAVCARTHPLGSGPLVWYQKFEYAYIICMNSALSSTTHEGLCHMPSHN